MLHVSCVPFYKEYAMQSGSEMLASFDEMTVLKFVVTPQEARMEHPAEVRRYFGVG